MDSVNKWRTVLLMVMVIALLSFLPPAIAAGVLFI